MTGTVGTAAVSLALVAAAGALSGALITLTVCALVETRRLRHIRQQRRVITALTRRLAEVDAEGSRRLIASVLNQPTGRHARKEESR